MKNQASTLYDKPWKHAVAAIILFVLAYAAASWAIDSGRLFAYFLATILVILGINHAVKTVLKGK